MTPGDCDMKDEKKARELIQDGKLWITGEACINMHAILSAAISAYIGDDYIVMEKDGK